MHFHFLKDQLDPEWETKLKTIQAESTKNSYVDLNFLFFYFFYFFYFLNIYLFVLGLSCGIWELVP